MASPAPVRLMVATPLYGGAEADYLRGVIGAPCPKRRVNWTLVAAAAAT